MEDKPSSFILKPPPSPDALLPRPGFQFGPWGVAAMGLAIMFVVMACVLWRTRLPRAGVPRSIRKAAYREALGLLDEGRAANPRDAATLSSLVLRRYLAVVMEDPSLYETHEEFVTRHDALKGLPASVRSTMVESFEKLAALKYGKHEETGDPAPILASARELLETLNHLPVE